MNPRLLLFTVAAAALALGAVPAYGDVIFTLSAPVQSGSPGSLPPDANSCLPPTCALFSGSLTDTDTDGSIVLLNSADVTWSAGNPSVGFLTLDNTFFQNVPGGLEGDTADNFFLNSYTGPIFGIDIAPGTPLGIYTGRLLIGASGGTGDPGSAGFTISQGFTVNVVPEPSPFALTLAGLFTLALYRAGRKWRYRVLHRVAQ